MHEPFQDFGTVTQTEPQEKVRLAAWRNDRLVRQIVRSPSLRTSRDLWSNPMRLGTWNTAGRTAARAHLAELQLDVAVLPEWGKIPVQPPESAGAFVEFGEAGKRGLAVAAWGEWSVSAAELQTIDGVVIGGVDVDGPVPFHLLAVWSYLSGRPKTNPVIEALDAWEAWATEKPLVVAGDFNTGGWWQKIRTGPMAHFPIVDKLAELGLRSAYHADRGCGQGVDEEPTHWHSNGGAFMIDHIFTPTEWPITSVTVGGEDPWRGRSDHAPLVVETTPA